MNARLRLSLGLLLLLALAALFGPMVLPDPSTLDATLVYGPPSSAHWLGTDELGRDLLARLLVGARTTLWIAGISALLASLAGSSLGLSLGYLGGRSDRVFLRVLDLFASVPRLPLMLFLASVDALGPWAKVIVAMTVFGWMSEARIARASAQHLLRQDFVVAARQLGYPTRRILLFHVLPSAAGPLLVAATLSFGELVLYETMLSFLGLGVPPNVPSWGAMLGQGLSGLSRAPGLVLWPGALIFLTIAAIQAAGDGLASALDPRDRRG